ncbi:MAG TPA: TrbI/VirB10 family protein [Rhizomicrobium sp.]|nr:TrbI/VirB10 family protein [Rhizomicrobium sp.]
MSEPGRKGEPEGLVLRGKRRRVTRFRRNVVIGAAAAVTVVVCGAAWLALRTPSPNVKVGGDQAVSTDSKPPADRVARLPANYDQMKPPKLGPPLPGDLGAPIVNRERQLGMNPASGSFGEVDAEHAEHLRQAQLAQQAREAKVMFQVNSASPSEAVAPQSTSSPPSQTGNTPSNPTLADDQNQQQHKLDFTKQRDNSGIYNSHGLQSPASSYELFAGTVIAASLVTGINSDLPGLAIAQITQNAYGLSGVLLLPAGSKLIGKVDSVVAFGQSRALVVWQRIIMPNGSSIEIDNTPATDTEGYTGLEDGVDYHTWRLIKGVALSTLLGVGTQLSVNNSNDDLLTALRQSAQDSANQAGQQITQRNLSIQPTLTIRPGWPLRAILSKDLLLQPYSG